MISKFDIEKYLEIVFRKNIINITKNEMLNLNCITLEFKKTQEDEKTLELSDIIKLFPNLKKIILKNAIINQKILKDLSTIKIEYLEFVNCSIQDEISFKELSFLKELSTTSCSMLNFRFIQTLNSQIQTIIIRKPIDEKTIDISIISNYVNLKNLILENCIIDSIEKLTEFQKLEKLSLLWSEIKQHENINVFNNLPLLKELYISDYSPEFAKKIPPTIKIYRDYNHLTSLKE